MPIVSMARVLIVQTLRRLRQLGNVCCCLQQKPWVGHHIGLSHGQVEMTRQGEEAVDGTRQMDSHIAVAAAVAAAAVGGAIVVDVDAALYYMLARRTSMAK